MKKTMLAAFVAALLAGPALAEDYASLTAKLDTAMAATQADEVTMSKVASLKAEGEAKSKAGDAEGSMKSLEEALKLLGVTQ